MVVELKKNMTEEEEREYMSSPATREELVQALYTLMGREVEPFVNQKFAFLVALIRYMLGAAGAMSADAFDSAYQAWMDEFTKRYGEDETEEPQAETGAAEA